MAVADGEGGGQEGDVEAAGGRPEGRPTGQGGGVADQLGGEGGLLYGACIGRRDGGHGS